MGVLQRFERRVETLVNGAFARAFKSEVKPVEIAAALQREADDKAQVLSRERVMVPNSYVVELSPRDSERLDPWSEPLRAELAAMVAEHAEAQGYSPTGRVGVEFERHDDLDTGMFRVRSRADAAPPPVRVEARRAPAPAPAPAGAAWSEQERRPPAPVPRGADATVVQRVARTPEPWLEVEGARVPLRQGVTVIGRGSEADLRLDDPGVSRRHASLQVAGSRARLLDLGSTNGTIVAGQRVRDTDLRDGDTVVLGRSTVVFHSDAVALRPDAYGPAGEDPDSFVPGLR
ncbi:type III secretion system (T3SS) inner membrane Yop/YscD-like protein [Motilibacter peucedani]|uniref:Type III secretion system (T3SS) inner membrane Yop/YscD-like protein n=1 Tax=Motilibacter peucedani TaxID=598650 RepID=A0A420XU31_9ACTN|nr:DUF3662 and FHA domain-containing protein [Motilibacter peucedani]RKS80334.1 type III secretion system (T3SS) inner membrane Yop/YscD-like protein [Motilibacter peucedani]